MRSNKTIKQESEGILVYEEGVEFPYHMIKSRRKTVALQILKNSEIVVRLPMGLSWQTGHDFVIKNKNWIYNQVMRVKEARAMQEEFHWVDGAEVLLHGEKKRLLVYIKKTGRGVEVWETGEDIRVVGRPPDVGNEDQETDIEQWVKTSVEQWYKKQAKDYLVKRTTLWAQRMGTSFARISIRDQATRWGSCSTKGNLNFNWKLVLLPEELADYVVVHELGHRFHMDHSSDFWGVVEDYLPDYKQRRKLLKDYGEKINLIYGV